MIVYTEYELLVLAHAVVDPLGWISHTEAKHPDTAQSEFDAKITRVSPIYDAAVADLGENYKNRQQRDTPDPLTGQQTKDLIEQSINKAMYFRFEQGIRWALNGNSEIFTIPINNKTQRLFNYTATLRSKGRSNSHGGYLRHGNTQFNINDNGLEELSIFAGEWGFAIQRRAFDVLDTLEQGQSETDEDWIIRLNAFDPLIINWSIDWSVDPQNNGMGWDNDLCLQNP